MSDENLKKTESETQAETSTKSLSFISLMGSLLAGWFGVSSQARRERDFEHGKFSHFVIGGIIFAILFVLVVVGLVKIVLSTAGA